MVVEIAEIMDEETRLKCRTQVRILARVLHVEVCSTSRKLTLQPPTLERPDRGTSNQSNSYIADCFLWPGNAGS